MLIHDDSVYQLNEAVEFCRSRLTCIDHSSLVQSEHSFDSTPFADIAVQQRDHIPSIRQIPLSGNDRSPSLELFELVLSFVDYFLRASKLGLQCNVLYSHTKPHPSMIDTAVAGRLILPANCRFLWSDMKKASILVSGETHLPMRDEPNMFHAPLSLVEGTKYSFIVLDPPWLNKSVRRKRVYAWSDFSDIQALPLEDLIDRQRPSLICCWSTNCDRIEEFIKTDLFPKWGCKYLTTWHWLKVDLTCHR